MKNDTMFSNVNQRLAETVANRHSKAKSVNQQLLQMISKVRSLQDQLIAQQYRQQLLLQQNQAYKQALSKLDNKNKVQEMQLKKLEEQMQLHRIKNVELHNCEQSLRSLEEQINDLTEIAQRKTEECESMQLQQIKIARENEDLNYINKELYQKKSLVNAIMEDYLKQNQQSVDSDAHPIDFIRLKLETLRQSLAQIQDQSNKIKRDNAELLNIQKQKTIKLEYQEQLLKQREKDGLKINQIAKICKSQQNLQSVVQQMLAKQDELVQQLKRAKQQNQYIDEKIRRDLSQIEQTWDQQKQSYQRQLRQLRKDRQNIRYEVEYLQSQLQQRKQNIKSHNQDYELNFIAHQEMNQWKRLREAQQRNNYYKWKIRFLTQIKKMIKQQKAIRATMLIIY